MNVCPQCSKDFDACQCATRLVPATASTAAVTTATVGGAQDSTGVHDSTGVRSLAERDASVANAPQVVGYEHLKLLGRGASSAVFLAEKLSMAKQVALKVLYQTHLTDERALKRFEFESRALSNLSHPNIVNVFDVGIASDGTPFIAMEFADGVDLKELISQNGVLEPERAIKIFCQLCDALACAHEHGLIHRDLKPSNVVIVRDWQGEEVVKLVDFGIAKPTTEGGEIQRLTQTGELLGSPAYMSPEQIRSADADARSDIYSLGCMMYEALTGRPPFRGESIIKTLTMHLEETPKPVDVANPALDKWKKLSEVVMQCLAKDATERPASAREVKTSISALLPSKRMGPETESLVRLNRIVIVMLVAGLVLVVLALWRKSESQPNGGAPPSTVPAPSGVSSPSAVAAPSAVSAPPAASTPSAVPTSDSALEQDMLELARANVLWDTNMEDARRQVSEITLKRAIARKAPVKTLLAIGVSLFSGEEELAAMSTSYQLLKPQIDRIVKAGSSDVESLFASYILWYLGDAESSKAQDLRKTNRAASDEMAKSSLEHLQASLFLAKCRNNEDARGLIADVSKDLGIVQAFQKNYRAARENYKRSFDAFLDLCGADDSDTIEVVKLLAKTSKVLYESEKVSMRKSGKVPAYLQTTHEALSTVAKANPTDDELRQLTKAIEELQ